MESESFIMQKRSKDMNKKLLELLDSINSKKQEVKDLVAAGNLENAKKAKEELKNLQE